MNDTKKADTMILKFDKELMTITDKEKEFLEEVRELVKKYEMPVTMIYGNGRTFSHIPEDTEKEIQAIQNRLKEITDQI